MNIPTIRAVALTAGTMLLFACQPHPSTNVTSPPQPSANPARSYIPLTTESLRQFAQAKFHLGSPPSLGAPVTLTAQTPSADNAAYLAMWYGDLFDPTYGPVGVIGKGSGNTASSVVFGIYILQAAGNTIVDCEIAGSTTMGYAIAPLASDGTYTGDSADGTLQADNDHWTLAIPASATGEVRVLFTPPAPAADLWGCQLTPVIL